MYVKIPVHSMCRLRQSVHRSRYRREDSLHLAAESRADTLPLAIILDQVPPAEVRRTSLIISCFRKALLLSQIRQSELYLSRYDQAQVVQYRPL